VGLGTSAVTGTVGLGLATATKTVDVITDPIQAAKDGGAAIVAAPGFVADKTVQGAQLVVAAPGFVVDKTVQGVDKTVQGVGKTVQGVVDQTSKGAEAVVAAPGFVVDQTVKGAEFTTGVATEFSALMMGGIEMTFETLGVSAGFQAVMKGLGEDLDTSDAGLEKLFKEMDYECAITALSRGCRLPCARALLFASLCARSGSGQISEKEMQEAIFKM
jgi:hypothetical protein